MKLLISNDDGIFALGIRALANELATAGHEVTVVCPDRERSATGHGLTLHQPIRAEKVESMFHPSVKAWACSGTPSDCVKLALWALLESPPDLVLSGINHGSNLGTDVLYSGTVAAAMEGVTLGVPSVAISFAGPASDLDGLLVSPQPASMAEPLTPREVEVLGMLAEGQSNKSIAYRLGISEHTVKFHVTSIMGKLNAGSRTEAVTQGIRQGLIML